MRLRNLVPIAAMMVLPFGLAFGQSVSLDHTDGLLDADHLDTGVPITFYIRFTGDGDNHTGITNGFRVYSDDGALWNPAVGTNNAVGWDFTQFFVNHDGITGSGADTVGFGGFSIGGTGLPAGYDDVVYTIDIGPIAESEIGKSICFDSSYYPPSGIWKWAGPNIFPSWDGPHCYTIGQGAPPPTIDCPGEPLAGSACAGDQICVALAITDAETVTVVGATWSAGQLCLTADTAGSYQFHIEATNAGGIATCDLTVNVTIDPPPAITCPGGPIVITNLATTVCEGLPISDADAVTVTSDNPVYTATWSSNQICFNADVAGSFIATVIATNACGADTCAVQITIEELPPPNNPPVIAILDPFLVCADSTIEILITATDIDLDPLTLGIANPAANMTFVDSGNGQMVLTFTPDMTQLGVFEVIAHASDGIDVDSMSFTITVEDCTPPCVEMFLSQTDFIFNMTTSDPVNPDPQFLTVYSDLLPFGFEIITAGEGWLVIDPLFGGNQQTVSIGVDGLTLAAGAYEAVVAVVGDPLVVCDPNTQYFTVTLNVTIPPSENDVISIPTVPAVLGAHVAVPISMEFLCDLAELDVWLGYTTNNLIQLDSVSFAGSLIEAWANKNVTVGTGTLNLAAAVSAGEALVPAAAGLLMTLHFNVLGNAAPGFYAINGITPDPIFTYDCGAGPASVVPTIINGGIVVGTSENYVCGYVVDPNGHSIEGATVELWPDFPYGNWDDQTHSDASGLFQFFSSTVIPFDVYAYKEGYYPGKVENLNYAQTGIMIVLTPVQPVTPTPEWVNFYCDANFYMNAPLPVGSVIDAYDPNGVHCGSWFVSEAGRYGFMPVYRDDQYTPEDDGADPGDNIRLYVNGVQAYTPDPTVWTSNGDIHLVCLDVGDIIIKTCDLFEGWNLVSWNLDHEIDDIAEVLASIEPCLEVVLGFEGEGLTYDPNLPMFSNLKFVDHLSGYWIKVSCDITLEIAGEAVAVTTGIPLINGWNLVSYLPDYSLPTQDALASIHDDLIVALGWDPSTGGLQYQPDDYLHNNLLEMGPCNGYWLKNDLPGVLTYPGAGPKIAPQPNRHIVAAKGSLDGVTATNTWMNVYSQRLTLDGATVKAGTQVTAHNDNGLMIGRFVIEQNGLFGFMAVYGDDQTTDKVDGARPGEAFSLRIDGVETHETFTFNAATGSQMEIGSLTAKGNSDANLPSKYSLGQNYPNPFNPTTTIRFALPTTSKASIEIYNVLGRLVSTPFDGIAQSGVNEVIWDGTNSTGEAVASGIYFYRLKTEGFTETKKMTLLK